MDPETEKILKHFSESEFFDVESLPILQPKAREIRKDSPFDSLRILEVVAAKLVNSRFGPVAEKYGSLAEASALAQELGQESDYIEMEAAKVAASLGDYRAAGHHYERAARAMLTAPRVEFGPTIAPGEAQAGILRQAESYYKLAGLAEYEERVRYERLLLHRDHEAKFWPRARSWTLWAVWGWGERPWRVAGTAGCLIVLFALGFWAAGVKPPDGKHSPGFGDCLYLSTVTFTTLGYGDYLPVNAMGKLLSCTEALLGILFTGMFLVTFVKKYSG